MKSFWEKLGHSLEIFYFSVDPNPILNPAYYTNLYFCFLFYCNLILVYNIHSWVATPFSNILSGINILMLNSTYYGHRFDTLKHTGVFSSSYDHSRFFNSTGTFHCLLSEWNTVTSLVIIAAITSLQLNNKGSVWLIVTLHKPGSQNLTPSCVI